ncbi:hypothetical protein K1719_006560 [Acacia pycnantha]|nr:hypothetical protein K1719_006560 [Acacia pycnantha]
MEKKMKRARERDDETEPRSLDNAKKRDLYGINLVKENQQEEVESTEKASSSKTPQQPPWDSHLALGVFDFPWLKDGVTSKTDDHCFLDFEDKFSSSLENQDGIHFSEAYCYGETSETSKMVMETVWQPFESDNGLEIKAEDVDCIWSSLINKNNHERKILM